MKIMVCYDGSQSSNEALRVAKRHAKAFEASLVIVTSMEKGTENEREEIQRVENELKSLKTACVDEGYECRTHLLIRGLSSGEDLVAFAREKEVDEIVIGVRRRSKVGKIVFGSTAQYVIIKAHCPVVTVK